MNVQGNLSMLINIQDTLAQNGGVLKFKAERVRTPWGGYAKYHLKMKIYSYLFNPRVGPAHQS